MSEVVEFIMMVETMGAVKHFDMEKYSKDEGYKKRIDEKIPTWRGMYKELGDSDFEKRCFWAVVESYLANLKSFEVKKKSTSRLDGKSLPKKIVDDVGMSEKS